jgi:hypothetical protein
MRQKSKPLAWRNSWDIPELSKKTDAAVRERDAGKREKMYMDLQKEVMDQGPGSNHDHVPTYSAACKQSQCKRLCDGIKLGRCVL